MKKYLNTQIKMKMLELQNSNSNNSSPLKFQAYERLTLFLERIHLVNLILRIRTTSMTADDLKNALLIAVQHEYEHNIAQQIYVSEPLWKIILLAKQEVFNIISLAGASIPAESDQTKLVEKIFEILEEQQVDVIAKAQGSIRKEATLILQ